MTLNNSMLDRYVVPDMPATDDLLPYLRQIDTNQWYSNFGPLVQTFEQQMVRHLAATANPVADQPLYLTTLSTGYDALCIGLKAFHLPPASNVLMPAVTFPACPLAVLNAGLTPILGDVDVTTWQLTPEIARRVAARNPIRAVMPVAVYGVPVPWAAWDAFVEETGIPVIIDAAAAFEVQPIPARCLVAHSLHATKPLGVGEGGVLVGRQEELIRRARCLTNFGTENRITYYSGTNAKMSEYHGAIGLAQMARWQHIKQKRQEVLTIFRTTIARTGMALRFQRDLDQAVPSIVMLQGAKPNAMQIVDRMRAAGILAHQMYLPPLYRHPYFARTAVADVEGVVLASDTGGENHSNHMPNSEWMMQNLFGLPFHPFLGQADIDQLVGTLDSVLKQCA